MAIKLRNKRSVEFSTASMSDLVFLLLVFFILVSTIVSPNAIPLLLPNSTSDPVIEAKRDIEVYIDDQLNYYIQDQAHRVEKEQLQAGIAAALGNADKGSVMLKVDQSVAVQYVVNVIDAVNKINTQNGRHYKVVLATKPE
ncbi:MAG: biopolymer transporter ExbD [Bacteroidales bacterium]|nr:biopolymer transporter ExbD [Bacteroidales bacterium]